MEHLPSVTVNSFRYQMRYVIGVGRRVIPLDADIYVL